MAGRRPPILEPKPAVIEYQGPYVYEGLDLWRQALRREYNRQVAAPGVADKWVRLAQAKRNEAERTRYFNDFYSDLPSPVRRAWEWESHKRWPRPSSRGPASYLDVYANEDEIYYTRKAGRWSMGETQIRDMYNEDFQTLDQGTQDRFRDKALKIADARGAVPPWRVFKPARDVTSNGLRQDPGVLAEDRNAMALKVKALLSKKGAQWAVASAFGGGGTFGEAIVWRVRDTDNTTLAKVFLKRDKSENDDISDKERRLLWDVHFSRNDHRYLPALLGTHDSGPDSRGRTWLEYAIYGDFHHFLAYYVDNELVIPEPFAWYLLHCLAQALHFLEKGHNNRHDKNKHPTWTPKYHYDIKPGNILLDAPEEGGPEWCREYPKPILTDLGGAEDWPATTDRDQIPNHVRGGGTPRFSSFELFPHIIQYWSNKERTAGPARPAPANPPANAPIGFGNFAFPPTISRRATPHKDPLPENTHVRMHTSIHQVGVVLWCLMASRTSPAGKLFAWRGAAAEGNPYPAWWDRLPAHQPRRPWPWRVAKKGDREKYKALADRKWARGVQVVVKGGGKRVRPVPKGLDRLGVRAREWVAGGWEPYGPEEALKPAYSGRLVELVYRCMSPLPEDRPTPSQLWDDTAKAMDDITKQYPDGSRRRPPAVQLQPDKFPIGAHVLRDRWDPGPGPGLYGGFW